MHVSKKDRESCNRSGKKKKHVLHHENIAYKKKTKKNALT